MKTATHTWIAADKQRLGLGVGCQSHISHLPAGPEARAEHHARRIGKTGPACHPLGHSARQSSEATELFVLLYHDESWYVITPPAPDPTGRELADDGT